MSPRVLSPSRPSEYWIVGVPGESRFGTLEDIDTARTIQEAERKAGDAIATKKYGVVEVLALVRTYLP